MREELEEIYGYWRKKRIVERNKYRARSKLARKMGTGGKRELLREISTGCNQNLPEKWVLEENESC